MAELKKAAAQVGVNPMGSQDEILTEYIEYLKANQASSFSAAPVPSSSNSGGGGGGGSGGAAAGGAKKPSGVEVAKKVLELGEVGEYESILNLAGGGVTITRASPIAQMRKCYLKLSLVIHPDRYVQKRETEVCNYMIRGSGVVCMHG
jgi:hypothetical protein